MNEKEKNISIDLILDRGLNEPRTAGERISTMLKDLGLRFIFWDTGYSLFFAALTLIFAFGLFMLAPDHYRTSAAVAVSPLLLLFAVTFAETSERLGGLYEIKQTCRYTIRQIAALRIVCYCMFGTVFAVVVSFFGADREFGFASLLPLCLSALFVYSASCLCVMHRIRNRWSYAAFSSIWILATISLPFSFGERWEHMLQSLPTFVSIGFAGIGAALFVWQISKMLREVDHHAVA